MNRYTAFLFLALTTPIHAQVLLLPSNPGLSQNITYVQAGANLFAAKTAASAGTTIVVGPGLFSTGVTNLLKNNVNWIFNDTVISNGLVGAACGIFDDTYEGSGGGAITSSISGSATFIINVSGSMGGAGNFSPRGVVTLSNANSQIYFKCKSISNPGGNFDAGFTVFDGNLIFDVDTFDFSSGGPPMYWAGGNASGRFNKILAANDSPFWVEGIGLGLFQPATGGNWYIEGKLVDSALPAAGGRSGAIYIKTALPQNKLWLNVQEIHGASVAAGYGGVLTSTTGKVYLTYQKLSGVEDTTTPRTLIQVDSGEAWLSGEKITITNNQHFVAQSGGKLWIRNQHYEDAGVGSSTRPYNYIVSGGTNFFQGGRADTSWGPFFRLTGGQTIIEDATINTFATLQMSNNCLWVNAGSPVLKNVTLIPGGLYSISNSSGGALDFRGYGWVFSKSNFGVNVTWRPGQSNTVVDGTYVDR